MVKLLTEAGFTVRIQRNRVWVFVEGAEVIRNQRNGHAMRLIQIIPKGNFKLYSALVAKELELRQSSKGTFRRTGSKQSNCAKWGHERFDGWLWLERGVGEVVTVQLQSRTEDESELQLLRAFIGFVDRHFADKIQAVNIQYPSRCCDQARAIDASGRS